MSGWMELLRGASVSFKLPKDSYISMALLVMLDGGAIVSAGVESVRFGAGAEGDVSFAA